MATVRSAILMRPADAPPLGTIRSLACFLSAIEEVRKVPAKWVYVQDLSIDGDYIGQRSFFVLRSSPDS